MSRLAGYVLTIVSAAIICCIIRSFCSKGTVYYAILNMVCGIFMMLSVVLPVMQWDFGNISDIGGNSILDDGKQIAEDAEAAAQQEIASIIRKQIQAYILDRAASLGLHITAEVQLDESTFVPISAELVGDISPYDRVILSQYIEDTIGIPEEAQSWK